MKRAVVLIAAGFVVAGCNQNRDVQDVSGAGGPSTRTEYTSGSRTGESVRFERDGSELTPSAYPQSGAATDAGNQPPSGSGRYAPVESQGQSQPQQKQQQKQ
jgi:predicted small secreted protein